MTFLATVADEPSFGKQWAGNVCDVGVTKYAAIILGAILTKPFVVAAKAAQLAHFTKALLKAGTHLSFAFKP